jgi:hypothetical protein
MFRVLKTPRTTQRHYAHNTACAERFGVVPQRNLAIALQHSISHSKEARHRPGIFFAQMCDKLSSLPASMIDQSADNLVNVLLQCGIYWRRIVRR